MFKSLQDILDRVARWVVFSSADPSQVSLSVKAALVAILPVIMTISSVGHWNVGQDSLSALINFVGDILLYGLSAVAAVMGAWGAVRKVWLSLSGQNKVNLTPPTP